MNPLATCLPRETLSQFLKGCLPTLETERVVLHLGECEACLNRVRGLESEDAFFRAFPDTPASAEATLPVVDGLTQQLKALAERDAAFPSVPGHPPQDAFDFLAPAQQPDELGRLGSFRVLELLGAGGMGLVFRAEDTVLRRQVALKVMKPSHVAEPLARARFLREARAAAAMRHENIVTVYQAGEDHGASYLAMEFLQGESLDRRLERDGKLPVAEALRMGRQTAQGLSAAHHHGLIHRDIKPANIWLEKLNPLAADDAPEDLNERGHVKILDFGLTRPMNEHGRLTRVGAILGTPPYMSPEQFTGEDVDARSDLFSLGCVLYQACTGRRPFPGEELVQVRHAVLNHKPAPPSQLNISVPADLSDLILRLLAKNREHRPASAREVAAALAALQCGTAESSRPVPVASPVITATLVAAAPSRGEPAVPAPPSAPALRDVAPAVPLRPAGINVCTDAQAPAPQLSAPGAATHRAEDFHALMRVLVVQCVIGILVAGLITTGIILLVLWR